METKPVIQGSSAAATDKAEEGSNALGISRLVYAAGYAFKDSMIAMAAIAGSLIAALTIGRKIPGVQHVAEWLLKLPENAATLVKTVVGSIPVVGQDILRMARAVKKHGGIVGASVGAGWLISHLVLAPSSRIGYKKAQKAVDKYNDLAEENMQLKQENARLKNDEPAAGEPASRAGFTEAQKPPGASFVERAAMESPSMQSGVAGR